MEGGWRVGVGSYNTRVLTGARSYFSPFRRCRRRCSAADRHVTPAAAAPCASGGARGPRVAASTVARASSAAAKLSLLTGAAPRGPAAGGLLAAHPERQHGASPWKRRDDYLWTHMACPCVRAALAEGADRVARYALLPGHFFIADWRTSVPRRAPRDQLGRSGGRTLDGPRRRDTASAGDAASSFCGRQRHLSRARVSRTASSGPGPAATLRFSFSVRYKKNGGGQVNREAAIESRHRTGRDEGLT